MVGFGRPLRRVGHRPSARRSTGGPTRTPLAVALSGGSAIGGSSNEPEGRNRMSYKEVDMDGKTDDLKGHAKEAVET